MPRVFVKLGLTASLLLMPVRLLAQTSPRGIQLTGADPAGVHDSTAAIRNAIDKANAAGKALVFPAGTYLIATGAAGGTLFNVSSDGVWIKCESRRSTIFKTASHLTLTGTLTVFNFTGTAQGIEGCGFQNGSEMSGSGSLTWVALGAGGSDWTARDNEFTGGYGGNVAGGSAISTYTSLAHTGVVNTILGTPVSPGTSTLTPASMTGIYVGKRLLVDTGAVAEDVIVTARNATEFTGRFKNSHAASAPVTDRQENTQRAVIENNYIHDCYACSAIVLNSGGSVVRNNRIVNIGSSSLQHGIYVQSGHNVIEHNWIEGVRGYGIHGHKAVPEQDASGDVYNGNTLINYGATCILVDSIPSDGANPEAPSLSVSLTRYVTIVNNTCQILNGAGASGIIAGIQTRIGPADTSNAGGALIANNTLEDACGSSPSCSFIAPGAFHNAAILGNHVRLLNQASSAPGVTGINLSGTTGALVLGNIIENWYSEAAAVYAGGTGSTVSDNVIATSSGAQVAAALNGSGIVFCGNHVGPFGGVRNYVAATNLDVCDNVLTGNRDSNVLEIQLGTQSRIHNNTLIGGYLNIPPSAAGFGLAIYENSGEVRWNNTPVSNAVVMSPSMGRLMAVPAGTNPLVAGLLVKIDSAGRAAPLVASDTTFLGIGVQDKTVVEGTVYVASSPGAEFDGVQTDGRWAAGHYGAPSNTEPGKLHDIGLAQPSNGSYVLFENSGASAGSARVLLVKTL